MIMIVESICLLIIGKALAARGSDWNRSRQGSNLIGS
jgi:hypothetical protein